MATERADGGTAGQAKTQSKDPPWPRPAYSWYVVAILLLAYTLSFVDRMILSLLVAPIRAALDISDTQVSLLIGLAFALFYTLLGLPLAWIADRYNRRNLIVAGIAVWSVMTAGCGFAGSYASLFAARMGVGVGEATLSPAAYSMLSDYFPRDRLARAMAVYSIGVPLGSGVAMILGSFVVQAVLAAPTVDVPFYGPMDAWRLIFVWVAAPGILVALLMLTVREPLRRGRRAAAVTPDVPAAGAPGLVAHIGGQRAALGALFGGMSLIGLVMYGAIAWIPTFFARSYGMDVAQAGLWFGVIMAVGGAFGLIAGGALADRLFAKGVGDAHLRVMRLSILLGGPPLTAMALMPDPALAFAMLALAFPCLTMHGVGGVALQLITPNEYRARMTAIYFFVVNLVGLGFGPMLIALLTDNLFQDESALRYSIAVVAAAAFPLAAIILTWGFKGYARELARS
ncbi:MFS transporter [Sphingopyxis sp.]|uniref:spinster family MFS transporter n=1 Tax=Sphingopyxis sp. TaxID=1908224 RepID=UPI002D7843CD|nr:MFS transporter [Sphingopyxis sp.]HET6523974.1 MFS transporter [Sphingopyxis sp.]